MKAYTVVFGYHDSDFEVSIETNHFFEVESKELAMEIAENLQNISNYFKVFYDKSKRKMVVEVTENEYFDQAFISNFMFYDETKGDYLHLELENGETLYPVANPECLVELREDHFTELLEEKYQDYLQDHDVITFSSLAYGVKESNVDVLVLD